MPNLKMSLDSDNQRKAKTLKAHSQLCVDGLPADDLVLRLEERPPQRYVPLPLLLRQLGVKDLLPSDADVARRPQRYVIKVAEQP